MNYLEIYEKISKAGDVLELRGESKTFMDGFNTCLFLLKNAFKNIPSVNYAIENKKLLKDIEELKKNHQKEVTKLNIELDDFAHKFSELEKQKVQTVTKTIVKKVKIKQPDSDEVILLEYGFKKPVKLNTTANEDIVYAVLSQVINGRIKNSKDAYNEKLLKRDLLSTLIKNGYPTQIVT